MSRTIEELDDDLNSKMVSLEQHLVDCGYDVKKELDAGFKNMVLYGCECYQLDSYNRIINVPLSFILE